MARNASRYQIPTLRYIDTHVVLVKHLMGVHNGHVASMLKGEPLITVTSSDQVVLTKAGEECLHNYDQNQFGIERKMDRDLTDTVDDLIRLAKIRMRRNVA